MIKKKMELIFKCFLLPSSSWLFCYWILFRIRKSWKEITFLMGLLNMISSRWFLWISCIWSMEDHTQYFDCQDCSSLVIFRNSLDDLVSFRSFSKCKDTFIKKIIWNVTSWWKSKFAFFKGALKIQVADNF